jgi:hypothetical protein
MVHNQGDFLNINEIGIINLCQSHKPADHLEDRCDPATLGMEVGMGLSGQEPVAYYYITVRCSDRHPLQSCGGEVLAAFLLSFASAAFSNWTCQIPASSTTSCTSPWEMRSEKTVKLNRKLHFFMSIE